MKKLTIIDMSHTSSRMLFTAISKTNPIKKDGLFVTSDYSAYYKYLMFNSLQYIKNQFKGEVIIAMDSNNNWRKDFYSQYKEHRTEIRKKSPINFSEYYELLDEVAEVIEKYFPFKVIKVPKTEADDIAGVLANEFGNKTDVSLITSDHDWKQVLAENVYAEMWDPIKKQYQYLSSEEKEIMDTPEGPMSRFTVEHALIGDAGDNVPSIADFTVFSDAFISYLKENQITTTTPEEFLRMTSSSKLIENYDVFKMVTSGKLKGQFSTTKDIYKPGRLGAGTATKITKSNESLAKYLNTLPIYLSNFKRNCTLVDFGKIPTKYKDAILESYHTTKINYDEKEILNYFINENLGKLVNTVNKFYDFTIESKGSSLDDFF